MTVFRQYRLYGSLLFLPCWPTDRLWAAACAAYSTSADLHEPCVLGTQAVGYLLGDDPQEEKVEKRKLRIVPASGFLNSGLPFLRFG
jgi:hypothetical protein